MNMFDKKKLKRALKKTGRRVIKPSGTVGKQKNRDPEEIERLYRDKDYLDAYSQHTDLRVEKDPRAAIGGRWEEIGHLQFGFLHRMGLEPHHTLLDIGCGTLRGGRLFISYLDEGHYTGTDISPKALEFAAALVHLHGLVDKKPRLLLNEGKRLTFDEVSGERFDFLLAQSVFTHLQAPHLGECFEHIGRVMHSGSVFFFTFWKGDKPEQKGLKDFYYPFSFFESLAKSNGFHLTDRSREYPHPKGQVMVEMRVKRAAMPA